MSWRITIRDTKGVEHLSPILSTRTEAMLYACDLKKGADFVGALHASGERITKIDVETWRRTNAAMLKARVSPKMTDDNRRVITTALESAGVIFVDQNGEGPGFKLRKAK